MDDTTPTGSSRNTAQTTSERVLLEQAEAAVQARPTEPGTGKD